MKKKTKIMDLEQGKKIVQAIREKAKKKAKKKTKKKSTIWFAVSIIIDTGEGAMATGSDPDECYASARAQIKDIVTDKMILQAELDKL